jgi:hypothetical protein
MKWKKDLPEDSREVLSIIKSIERELSFPRCTIYDNLLPFVSPLTAESPDLWINCSSSYTTLSDINKKYLFENGFTVLDISDSTYRRKKEKLLLWHA